MVASEQSDELAVPNHIATRCGNNRVKYLRQNARSHLTSGGIVGKKSLLTPPKSRLLWQRVRKHVPLLCKVLSTIFLWIVLFCYVLKPFWPAVLVYVLLKMTEQIWMYKMYGAMPFDSTDSLWMQERPENRTIINALLILRGEVQISRARGIMQERLVDCKDQYGTSVYPRLKKYMFPGQLNYFWVEEERFSIDDHVKILEQSTSTKREQRAILSKLCSRPFQSKKSPWEVILIHHKDKNKSESTAVLFRAHHSMADGISLARLLIRVLPDNKPNEIPIRKFPAKARLLLYLKGIFFGPLYMTLMLLASPDRTMLNGKELDGKKKLTWSKPLDLGLIKRIKNATKVTVNDVLMSCYSGALRDFFKERGIPPPINFSVALPVDLRPDNNRYASKFKNNFAMIPFQLSINIKDPLLLLWETKKRMNDLKTSGEPFSVNLGMQLFAYCLPHFITRPICKFACEKTTAVLSNIPGPQNEMIIGGHALETMTFWPPQRDRIGMALSMSSYNGKIFVGVEADEALQLDPDEICKKYEIQLQRLASRIGVLIQ